MPHSLVAVAVAVAAAVAVVVVAVVAAVLCCCQRLRHCCPRRKPLTWRKACRRPLHVCVLARRGVPADGTRKLRHKRVRQRTGEGLQIIGRVDS